MIVGYGFLYIVTSELIPKGAAAMHCDPLPVIRDKGAHHGNLGYPHGPFHVKQGVLSGILQNVGHRISRSFDQGCDAPLLPVRVCKIHELSMRTNTSLIYALTCITKITFFRGCENMSMPPSS